MEPFLLRLLTGVLIIWFVDYVLAKINLKEPKGKIISVVTLIVVLLWIIAGDLLTTYFVPHR